MSVMKNTYKPESVLQKMNNAVWYHTLCESVAMGESLIAHIDGNENPTDLLTKVMNREKRRNWVNNILHDIYGSEFKPYAVTK